MSTSSGAGARVLQVVRKPSPYSYAQALLSLLLYNLT
jgi:hypothetical protein